MLRSEFVLNLFKINISKYLGLDQEYIRFEELMEREKNVLPYEKYITQNYDMTGVGVHKETMITKVRYNLVTELTAKEPDLRKDYIKTKVSPGIRHIRNLVVNSLIGPKSMFFEKQQKLHERMLEIEDFNIFKIITDNLMAGSVKEEPAYMKKQNPDKETNSQAYGDVFKIDESLVEKELVFKIINIIADLQITYNFLFEDYSNLCSENDVPRLESENRMRVFNKVLNSQLEHTLNNL